MKLDSYFSFLSLFICGSVAEMREDDGRKNRGDNTIWKKLDSMQKNLETVNETLIIKNVALQQYGAQPFFILLHDPMTDIYESKDVIESRPWHPHICLMFLSFFNSYRQSQKKLKMLDIGGNIGFMSILAASMYENLDIIAIEPAKRHAILFTESLKLQRLSLTKRIIIKNVAVGAVEGGTACMTWEAHNAAATSVTMTDKPCVDTAPITTVDAVINHTWPWIEVQSIDIVKMDIEGFEIFAMQGASHLLDNLRPKLLITEFVPWRMKKFGVLDPVTQFLSIFYNRGYIVRDILSDIKLTSLHRAKKYFNDKGLDYFTDLHIVDMRVT